tara:strand:+ start:1260 stop:1604 length:345 start_codon:yes stop_codon:yes gene_type:complete
MAISRYKNSEEFFNAESTYKKKFASRSTKNGIRQTESLSLRYPTDDEKFQLNVSGVFWGMGDRFYKLADKYYGSSEYWWVIAFFNKKSSEFDVEIGEEIEVPLELDRTLTLFGL